MPFRACSIGMVTSSSTSAAERPRHGVWISTRGGANSGKTSTGIRASWPTPKNISEAANATTRKRNLRLAATIERSMAAGAGAPYSPPTSYSEPKSSDSPTVTTSVPTGGPETRIADCPSMRFTSMGARTKTRCSGLV